jgi:hypothetical protein
MAKTWTETKLYEDEENDRMLDVEVTFKWVDNGIGAYECHGARGNHCQWEAEIVSVTDENGNFVDVDEQTLNRWIEKATMDGPQ